MADSKERVHCPRCGVSLYENLPRISLVLDFDKRDCIDTIFCSVCGGDLTNLLDRGKHGYSAMISCKYKGTPPWGE